MELSIFISYAHADEIIAREIASELAARNVKVWIDEGELRVGDSLIERISEALDEVHFVVALVSPYSVESAWCKKEISLAMSGGLRRKGIKVLPLRIGNVPMPTALADVLYLDVDPEDPGRVVDRLVRDAMRHQHEHDQAKIMAPIVTSDAAARNPLPPAPGAAPGRAPGAPPGTLPDTARAASPDMARSTAASRPPGVSGKPAGPAPAGPRPVQGTVKWWNADKGYGFIAVDGGRDVFAHFSAIQMDGFRNLEDGQRVDFDIAQTDRGPVAENIRPL